MQCETFSTLLPANAGQDGRSVGRRLPRRVSQGHFYLDLQVKEVKR
jgi:hypothetical protein